MLYEQLLSDYKIAMKEKQEIRKTALNFAIAQIKNKKIELQREPNEEEIITLLKKEVKAINETISFLEKTDKKQELAEEEEKKTIISSYLPPMLDKEATQQLIESTIAKLNLTDPKTQRGILMKELMAHHKAELNGAIINEVINTML